MLILVDYENVHNTGMNGFSSLTPNDTAVIFYGNAIKNIPFDLHVEIMNSEAKTEYVKTNKIAKNYLDFQLASYLGFRLGQGFNGQIIIISKDTGYNSIVDLWSERGYSILRAESIEVALKSLISGLTCGVSSSETKAKTPAKKKNPGPKRTAKTPKVNNESNDNTTESISTEPSNLELEEIILKNESEPASVEKMPKVKKTVTDSFPESFRKKVRQAVKNDGITASQYTSIYKFMVKSNTVTDFKSCIIQNFGKEIGKSVFEHTQNIYTEFHNL